MLRYATLCYATLRYAMRCLLCYANVHANAMRCYATQAEDDEIVSRLRAQGAVVVGLTVMTEGGVTPLGYAPFFDGPFNPHNASHYPGQAYGSG